ncbi:MAG: D-alanyl-D-alanine carboxypeptidase/D-alanyl-D-alanine-endopeptidase [Flavobacteriia bacterium]|nr:D-alanyl-D-alanine carboxypeptidase/D-alanyl-D-alanine-endopeptidase [Flavobacteriia bacterium]
MNAQIYNIFFSLFIISNVYTQTEELEEAKNKLINDSSLKNATFSICVRDLSTGNNVCTHQEQISMSAASTTKLFATASALEILGENYIPNTTLYSENKIDESGVLNGNIWIRGSGDASLGSKYFNKNGEEYQFLQNWVDTLYAMGLRKINGSIIGDGSDFSYFGAPDGWNWGDLGNYYGTAPCGLPIFDNVLRCFFNVPAKIGEKAVLIKTFPEIPQLNFNSYIYSANIKGDDSYIYGAPFSYDRFSSGYLPKNSSSFMVRGSLPDPEQQFADAFKKALIEKGIFVYGESKGARNMNLVQASKRYAVLFPLYQHKGRGVKQIVHWTNMRSVNLFAEQLVLWIAKEKTGFGDTDSGIKYIKRFWSNHFNTSGFYIKDGSGLSRTNAINTSIFCSLLEYMHKSINSTIFYESLPITGVSGTLNSVCKGQIAEGKIHAKSGTLNKVKSYAGYVETISGKKLAFSIIFNNYSCSNEAMMNKIEQFMNAMVLY